MKLVRYRTSDGTIRAGIVAADGAVTDAGLDVLAPTEGGAAAGALDDLDLVAPISRPGKIVCVGLNYVDHAAESAMALPAEPLLFGKFVTSMVGPGDAIAIPAHTTEVDYEAELGVVISRSATCVTEADALSYVAGYTCVNDVSARDLQFADGQWMRGKSVDTFCPVGPVLVTADEIGDPQVLGIRCTVNGETLQDATTGDMVFGVAALIAYISQTITLEPGDLIATGTPPGVGFARTPPIYLRAGDTVSIEIDGIGTLTNPVTDRVAP